MEKSTVKITTKAQFERLVQLMEKNPELAKGKQNFEMTKTQCKEAWEGFTIELNILGPPTRTSFEWQRVWIHYKAIIKKNLLIINKTNKQQVVVLHKKFRLIYLRIACPSCYH